MSGHWEETSLEAGENVGGVVLTKHLGARGGADVWMGRTEDGKKATVCALSVDAGDEAIDRYLTRGNEWKDAASNGAIDGVAPVLSVDPLARALAVDFPAASTLAVADLREYDEPKTVAFFRQIVAIVAGMHQAGVVHGWLRPQNVLLDARDVPAIVNARGLDLSDVCRMSPSAIPVHKPYTAPEVRLGSLADATADVYSLGRILHFMLVGGDPNENDERLPRIDPLRHITPDIHRVVRRCVLQDKSERYQDAGALLADIDKIGTGVLVGEPHPDFDPPELVKEAKDRKPVVEPRPSSRPAPKFKKPPGFVRPVSQRDTASKVFWGLGKAIPSGLLAVGLLAGAFVLTYLHGEVELPSLVMMWASAPLFALAIPGTGRAKILARGLVAALALGFLFFVNPIKWLKGSRTSGLHAATVAERVAALKELRAAGEIMFQQIDLAGADLSGVDMQAVVLNGSNLSGCICKGANFNNAETWNVDVTSADFSGANLGGVIPQLLKGWEGTTCDDKTIMPTKWQCQNGKPFSPPPAKK